MHTSINFKGLSSHLPRALSSSSSRLLVILGALYFAACTGAIQDPSQAEDPESGLSETQGERANSPETSSEGQSSSSDQASAPETAEPQVTRPDETPSETPVEDPIQEPVETPAEPDQEPTSTPLDELDREALAPSEGERVSLIEPPVLEPLSRARRRMNLDQLSLAIQEVSGGLMWSERVNNQERDLFVTLSDTLGKPDYIQSTTEDLTPSALFLKFLDDAARQVCDRRIELDLRSTDDSSIEPTPESIKLWGGLSLDDNMRGSPVEVEAQIRALVLRFHSRQLPEGDSPRLAYWRWLFETASLVDGAPLSGWRALCVTLINHPDFYSY